MAAAVVFVPLLAVAGDQQSFIDERTMESHRFAPSELPIVNKPYILGWGATVTPPSGFFENTNENGGTAIDVRTRTIYAGTREGWVVALGPGGEEKWRVDVGGQVLAPPTIYADYVLVGTSEGVLNILNKVTGERVARGILGEQLITQPVVAEFPGGVRRVYVGSDAESVFAVDLETGQKLWRAHRDAPAGFTVYGFAKPVVTEKAVFIGYGDGYVECRDPATGNLRWERHVSPTADLQDVDGLATNGSTLFAASYSGGVYALEPETGNIEWQKPMPGANHVVVDGATLYAGAPGLWQSMRTSDGGVNWRFRFDEDQASTDGVAGDRLFMFAGWGGSLYFVDKLIGEPEGVFSSGPGFNTPPAVVGPAVAVISNGGHVYTLTTVP